MKIYLQLFLAVFLLAFSNSSAAPKYDKIWELYTNSKYDEALVLIQEGLIENPKDINLLDMSVNIIKDKGDYKTTIAQMFKLIDAAPNPNPYIQSHYELFSFNSVSSTDEDQFEKVVNEVLENPKLDGTISASLRDELGNYYLARHNRSQAERTYRDIGSVSEWSLLGPFENLMGNGFDKYGEVLEKPQQTAFIGTYNAHISWYPISYNIPGRWIHMEQYCFLPRSIVFAQTFCKSKTDQDVYLRIGISGSLKVYVNDAIVLKENQEINNGIDAMSVKVHLNKGYNRILVQLGNSEGNGRVNFNLRLTNDKYNPIEGLEYSTGYVDYQKATLNVLPSRIDVPYLKYFIDQSKNKDVFEYYNKFKASQIASIIEDLDYLEEVGEELVQKYPNCSDFYSALLGFYSRTGNRTMVSELNEKIKKLEPNSSRTITSKISEAYDKENYTEVSDLLDKYKSVIGTERSYTYRISLLAKLKKNEEFYQTINTAYESYPDNPVFVELKYSMENGEKKNTSAAIDVLSDYLEKHYNMKLFSNYFYLLANSKPQKALVELGQFVSNHDYEVSPSYFALRVYDNEYFKTERINLINRLLTFAPNNSTLFYRRAQAVLSSSVENATKDLKTALEYYPYNYDALALQRTIGSKPNVFDLFQNPDYDKLFAEAKTRSDADIEILLDEDQMVLYDGGATELRKIRMIKSINEKGIDRLKEFNLPYYNNQDFSIEKAEVFKVNGNKLKGEINDNKVVFTNLEKGDAVFLIYKYKDYPIIGLNNQNIHLFPFNSYTYNQKRKITILAHPAYKFTYKSSGFDFKPVVTKVDDFDSYVWEQEKVERIEDEPSMPDYWDVGKYISISSIPDWKYINNWYQVLSNTSTENTKILDRTIKKIFPSGPSGNKLENARLIYEYIVKNVRYSSVWFRNSNLVPQEVSKTLSSRLGDCKDVSLTFKTLAEKVGIKSNIILVNTKDNGTMQYDLPSIEFNHCMVKMNIDNTDYFLELTSDMNGFKTVGNRVLNACYLEIGENAANSIQRINPNTRVLNSTIRKTVMNFESEKLIVSKEVLYLGDMASYKKSKFRNTEFKDQEKHVMGSLPDAFPNQQLISFDYNKDQANSVLGDTLFHSFKYEVSSPFTKVANLSVFKLPFSFTKTGLSILQSKQRLTNLCLWDSPLDLDYESEKFQIILPKGKKLTELPQAVIISNKYFDYSLTFTKNRNECIVNRECKYKTLDIPASEFNDFKNAMIKVGEAESVQLALQDGEEEPEVTPTTKPKKGKK
ncbi:MAG: hypothetical protein HYZ54_12525 [Ignavibacteriae bacterium]|nr:hypothetical protein [Ignavibacteriota bacterium]